MHYSRLWNQFNLLWSKVILASALIGLFTVLPLMAQQKQVKRPSKIRLKGATNLPNYDQRLLHYGFYISGGYTTFNIRRSKYMVQKIQEDNPVQQTSIYGVNAVGGPSFNVGFILNVRLEEHFDARLLPSVALYTRHIEYRMHEGGTEKQLNQSTFSFVELPVMLKFKSLRRGNVRMYMLGGIKPSLEVGAKRKETDESFLRTNNQDFAIEYGMGFDLYYPLFKFSPEIRFSHGISNMINRDDNPYSLSIKKMYTHTVSLYLNFE